MHFFKSVIAYIDYSNLFQSHLHLIGYQKIFECSTIIFGTEKFLFLILHAISSDINFSLILFLRVQQNSIIPVDIHWRGNVCCRTTYFFVFLEIPIAQAQFHSQCLIIAFVIYFIPSLKDQV